MKIRISIMLVTLLLALSTAKAADFSGKYHGSKLSIDLALAGADNYTGTIHLGDQQFPVKAHRVDDHIEGTFTSGGSDFPFSAELKQDTITLTSAGTIYTMDRPAAGAANPLGSPAQANPLASSGNPPSIAGADYTELASNLSGKTLFVQRPDIKTIQDALQFGMFYLGKKLDGKPSITKAYSDTQNNHQNGMASFTGKYKGDAIKGFIAAGLGDNGAAISIVFAKDNAPQADVAALVNAMPTDAKLADYQLPYNLGTMKVADGWKVTSVGQLGNIKLTGPDKQLMDLSDGLQVLAPNSPLAQRALQNGTMLVAPYCSPVDALKTLVPQISQINQAHGAPAVQIDKIIDSVDVQPITPNGKSARIAYLSTLGSGPTAIHYHEIGQFETYPLGTGGTWGVLFSSVSAPVDTFDRDCPVMLQMANSLKINNAAVARNSQNAINAQNQRFDAFEAQMKEKNDAFDSYMKTVQHDQVVTERSNANFDEIIRGYRTVEDTSTGNRTSVDLGNVDNVVDKLNQADPGRYKEIPLRDEMYPMPPNQ